MSRYAESGGVSIACETAGEGPMTLVHAHGFVGKPGRWELYAVRR